MSIQPIITNWIKKKWPELLYLTWTILNNFHNRFYQLKLILLHYHICSLITWRLCALCQFLSTQSKTNLTDLPSSLSVVANKRAWWLCIYNKARTHTCSQLFPPPYHQRILLSLLCHKDTTLYITMISVSAAIPLYVFMNYSQIITTSIYHQYCIKC